MGPQVQRVKPTRTIHPPTGPITVDKEIVLVERAVPSKWTTQCGVSMRGCRKCSTFRRLAGSEPNFQVSG